MYNNELYHFGVKGMRWGHRKKQYTIEQIKNKKQSNKKGLSTKQKKILIAGSLFVATSIAAYGTYKISNSRAFDRTIKAGKNFYRQGNLNELNKGLNEIVYATTKNSDRKKYIDRIKNAQSYTIRNSKDVKVAGTRTAEKIYNELLKTNPDFRSHYGGQKYKDFNGMIGHVNKTLINDNIKVKDTYMNPFYDALVKKGYSAVMDMQDQFAKLPMILINTNNDYKIIK